MDRSILRESLGIATKWPRIVLYSSIQRKIKKSKLYWDRKGCERVGGLNTYVVNSGNAREKYHNGYISSIGTVFAIARSIPTPRDAKRYHRLEEVKLSNRNH